MDESAAQIVAGNLNTAGTGPAGPSHLSWLAARGFGAGTLGFAVDVTDEGVDNGSTTNPAHPDFYENGTSPGTSRVAYQHDYTPDPSAADCGGHGTNVASIAAGYNSQAASANNYNDGAGYNYGLGVAPRVRIGSSKIFDCNGNLAITFSPTVVANAAYADGARISNNSWGFANNYGGYNADSQEYDSLVRDSQPATGGNQPMVEVFAAGNQGNRVGDGLPAGVESDDGYGSVIAPATAKNVITVGASEGVRSIPVITDCGVPNTFANNAKDILDYSSRGPTDDLRQKPDLVAPGTHLTGASPQHGAYDGAETCNPQFPAGNAFYSLISGTSQAAPGVAGAAALFRDWYSRTRPAPSPALTKAVLVTSASDLSGGSNGKGALTSSAPNADQGWGRVNLGSAISATGRAYVDQSVTLANSGTSDRRSYQVSNPASRVRVTLAWTDAPAMVDANPALVNNLDLVVSAGGRRYLGNVMAGGTSRVGGTPDTRNNVESVVLPAGIAGRLSVEVRGSNIAGNGVPGNPDATDQDFALVVSNVSAASASPQFSGYQTAISDTRPGGDGDGALEPGESATIGERLRNDGAAAASSISGKLTGSSALAVQRNTSAFAGVGVGGTTAAATPYAASLSASAVCGADVGASLNITSSGGVQSVPLSLGTGAAGPVTSTSSAAVPRSIPDDNSNGVESTLSVSGSGRIKDVDVVIGGITHPWVGDLALELRHPDGTTVELARHPGGPDNGGNNFTGTVFDDEAATNIGQASAPYTGRFRPQNDQLSRLDGKDKQGTWRLRVKDLFEANAGTLVSWGTGVRAAVCDWVSPAGAGSGTGGGPGTAPVPVPPRAPSFAVAPAGQRLADALGGRLTVLGACAAACRATAKLSVSGKVARSLGLTKRLTSRPVSLGTGSARRRSAGRLSYRVRLTRRARSALRGEDRVTTRLSVAVSVTGEQDVKLKQSVGLRSTAGLGSVARNGLRLRAACSRTCPLAVGLWLDARTARKLGLKVKKGKRQVRVASRRATVSSRGRALSLKMARATRAAAARQKRLSATLKAVAGPSAGPTRAASQTLVLRR
jgi:subtilisin-like proprotein convertase family protein